jgi:hypothetical protein
MFDGKLAPGSRGDLESIGCKMRIVQRDVEVDGEISRVSRAVTPNRIDAAARFDRVVERRLEAVRHESERVQEVTLAGTVPTDEQRERIQLDVALSDTLVVADTNAANECRRAGVISRRDRRCLARVLTRAHSQRIGEPAVDGKRRCSGPGFPRNR